MEWYVAALRRAAVSDGIGSQIPLEQKVIENITTADVLAIDAAVAVGDVKYKLAGTEWNRADLYQSVAFAAAHRARHAAVVTFQTPGTGTAPSFQVGEISVSLS